MNRVLLIGLFTFGIASLWAQVPGITSFSPASGPVGSSVTITGTNFSSTASNNIVYFGAVKASVITATATQLTVIVPIGSSYQPVSVTANGLTAYSKRPFVVTFPSAGIDLNSFSVKVDFSVGAGPMNVALADLDSDNKVDVVQTYNQGGSLFSIFKNTASSGSISSSSLGSKIDLTAVNSPMNSATVDFDGDGKLDIVVANQLGSYVSVYGNIGSGSLSGSSFATKVDFGAGVLPWGLAISDFDGDGKPDLGSATFTTMPILHNISIGPGSINFDPEIDITAPAGTYILAPDIDGDGKNDLAMCYSNYVAFFRNSISGGVINSSSFGTNQDFSVGSNPYAAFGDLDGDGKIDMAVVNNTTNTVSVFRNTSTPGIIDGSSFAAKIDFLAPTNPSNVAIGDLDGDGRPDLVVTGNNLVSIFRNLSSPGTLSTSSFSNKIDFVSGSNPLGLALGDIDGDGKMDLVICDNVSNVLSVFRNQIATIVPSISSFSPSSAAVGASVTINGTNFSSTPANNTVKFNGTTATVISSTATSITATVPTGATTGLITVTVLSQTGTSTTNFTVDSTPPVVAANSTASTIEPNTLIPVSANFTDASGIASAKVQYRPIAGAAPNNFITSDMTFVSGFNFSGTIPASVVTELGVEYKYLIVDGAGNDNSATQIVYKTAIKHASGLAITSYPGNAAGSQASNYRIIAIPLVLDNKTTNDVFNNVLGGYDPTIWRMFKYNGFGFSELNGTSALVPGEGYWFIAVSSSPLNTGPGTTVDVSTTNPFTITLNPGWNQIGNPYNFDISWADVIAANPTEAVNLGGNSSAVRVFRGSIDNRDVLKSLEGGFVKYLGTSAAPIKIPVSKNASKQGGRQGSVNMIENSLDQPSWEIMFNLKNGNVEYHLGGVGMNPEAKEGFDYHDDFNSPRFFDYLEVKFPKKYFGMTFTKDVVPPSENYSWKFSVESNLKEEHASLSWDNSNFGSAREIYLLDVKLHKVTNMRTQDHYSFNQTESSEFKVVFGNGQYVKQELLPSGIVLYDPYPNPFVNELTIGYALPGEVNSSPAQIEVYNSMGSRVSGVSTSEPGVGNWTYRSEEGSPGLYFVRLRVGGQSFTKKVLKR